MSEPEQPRIGLLRRLLLPFKLLYLEWQNRRLRRNVEAMELMAEVQLSQQARAEGRDKEELLAEVEAEARANLKRRERDAE